MRGSDIIFKTLIASSNKISRSETLLYQTKSLYLVSNHCFKLFIIIIFKNTCTELYNYQDKSSKRFVIFLK